MLSGEKLYSSKFTSESVDQTTSSLNTRPFDEDCINGLNAEHCETNTCKVRYERVFKFT